MKLELDVEPAYGGQPSTQGTTCKEISCICVWNLMLSPLRRPAECTQALLERNRLLISGTWSRAWGWMECVEPVNGGHPNASFGATWQRNVYCIATELLAGTWSRALLRRPAECTQALLEDEQLITEYTARPVARGLMLITRHKSQEIRQDPDEIKI